MIMRRAASAVMALDSLHYWVPGVIMACLLGFKACSSVDLLSRGAAGGAYMITYVLHPELNAILYFFAGKIAFEERLELSWGISANQLLQILFFISLGWSLAFRRRIDHFPKNSLGILCVLTCAMCVGLLYSDNAEYGDAKAAGYLLLVLPGIVYLGLRAHTPGAVWKILLLVCAVCSGMMLLGLKDLAMLRPQGRLSVLGGGPNVYARVLGTGFLLTMALSRALHYGGYRRLAWALMMFLGPGFVITLYYSGSKGPLIGFLLSIVAFAALHRFLRRTLMCFCAVAILGIVASERSRTFADAVQVISTSRLFLDPTAKVSHGSYGSRLDFYTYSSELVRGAPLLGVGTGAWGTSRKLFTERAYPHNIFVEVACEHGIAVALLLATYMGWLIWNGVRLLKSPMPQLNYILCTALLTCLFYWIFVVQVSGDLIDNRNLWLFAALVEAVVRMGRKGSLGEVNASDGAVAM